MQGFQQTVQVRFNVVMKTNVFFMIMALVHNLLHLPTACMPIAMVGNIICMHVCSACMRIATTCHNMFIYVHTFAFAFDNQNDTPIGRQQIA